MEAYQHDLSLDERIECGSKIRELRKQKGYPAWIVAELVDVDEETLRRYEAGERWPRFETAMRLAAVLGVKTDDFLPDGFFERHTPPQQLLESLGELLRFPVRMLAEQERGSRSNRRSSTSSAVTDRSASAKAKPGKTKVTQRKTAAKKPSPTRCLVRLAA